MVPTVISQNWPQVNVDRLVRRASLGAILALAGFVVFELLGFDPGFGTAIDQHFYRDVAARWLATGQFYLPLQVAGTYHVELMRDVLYPPIALWLFVPFYFLPGWLWYAVPVAGLGYALWRLRPAAWAWAVIALIAVWPHTLAVFLFGNTAMWAAALTSLGLVWGWPAPFVLFKPSLAPFALAGFRRRSWWLGLGVMVLACLPLGALWIDYFHALQNSDLGLLYALRDLPLMCVPVVAWSGRRRDDMVLSG
jgi:hypothetical protein